MNARQSVLFEIGHIRQVGKWQVELAQKSGVDFDRIDWHSVDTTIRRSFQSEESFRGRTGKISAENEARFLLLSTGMSDKNTNEPIFAKFKLGFPGGKFKWMGVDFVTENEFSEQFGPALFHFAHCPGPWIARLAKLAAPEPWTLKTSRSDYDVLFKYICYTFEKLQKDGQVVESADRAVFHTGLFTSLYEPIYAYFTLNHNTNRQKWQLADFCLTNKGPLGTEMARKFKLPSPANWFKDPARLFCDPELLVFPGRLDIDIEHCIVENASRLPLQLIKRGTQDLSIINSIQAHYDNDETRRASVTQAIQTSPDSRNFLVFLKNELIGAVDLARMKVLCDYTAAVPQFYPDHHSNNDGFGFLLPLSFNTDNPEDVDCALVIQPKSDGQGYNAETILTPDMAYSNARLLRRPNAHWLTERLKV